MAKVKIQGHASGTGVFTVTAPNSNTDRTITLPDADVTLGTDATKLPLAGGTVTGHLNVSSGGIKVGSDTLKTFGGYNFVQYGDRGMVGGYANDSLGVFYNTYHSSGSKAIETGTACNVQLLNGGIRFQTAASVSADAAQSLTDRLEITTDGRVVSQSNAHSWVNFDQSGTIAIRDSYNVSSMTDVAAGDAKVNFDVNHGQAYYAVAGMAGNNKRVTQDGSGLNAAFVQVFTVPHSGNTKTDESRVFVITFGDSA